MEYYLRRFSDVFGGETSHVWKVAEATASLYGFENVETGAGAFFRAQEGETVWDAMRRETPWFVAGDDSPFKLMELPPGHYFPRMARPIDFLWATPTAPSYSDADDVHAAAISAGQLSSLTRHLERIFQVVHPDGDNLRAYGNEIRNLLILACTEVEAQWRGILVANGVTQHRLRTDDYFALKDAMQLGEYSVCYPTYPWLPLSSPFRAWQRAQPSQSLAWYDAYNAVKHNREGEFKRATLQHVVDAVSACAVLLMAQYGDDATAWSRSEARDFFRFSSIPRWSPHRHYFYPMGAGEWSAVHYCFAS